MDKMTAKVLKAAIYNTQEAMDSLISTNPDGGFRCDDEKLYDFYYQCNEMWLYINSLSENAEE